MSEFQKYVQRYVDQIPSENWMEEMKNSGEKTMRIYNYLSEEQGNFAYAEGKWTLKILLQHLIDAEKIFAYRALRFSRNDTSELSGWDEDLFANENNVSLYALTELLTEFELSRNINLLFFSKLTENILTRKGIANGNEVSVETLGKLIVGHNFHHLNVIEERYLPNLK